MTKADYDELVRLRDAHMKCVVAQYQPDDEPFGASQIPERRDYGWFFRDTTIIVTVTKGTLTFISPNDIEPLNIAAAIAEYERAREGK